MRIGILDDEELERNTIKEYVGEYLFNKSISLCIIEFTSGEALISYCSDSAKKRLDLLVKPVERDKIERQIDKLLKELSHNKIIKVHENELKDLPLIRIHNGNVWYIFKFCTGFRNKSLDRYKYIIISYMHTHF